MQQGGNTGAPDSSILLPSSCRWTGTKVVASGTYDGGYVPEVYIRVGDVVELYVYTAGTSDNPQGTQLANLNGGEKPAVVTGTKWQTAATVDKSLGRPYTCVVAVQATHAFQGAGSAGG